jgi:hypothetical protein
LPDIWLTYICLTYVGLPDIWLTNVCLTCIGLADVGLAYVSLTCVWGPDIGNPDVDSFSIVCAGVGSIGVCEGRVGSSRIHCAVGGTLGLVRDTIWGHAW